MRFRSRTTGHGKRLIDMTPMIDCVFQLLLFFMVASNFEEESRTSGEGSLDANLPQAVAAMPMVMRPREMLVNVNRKGEYYVGGTRHTERELAERFRRSAIDNPGNQTVVIRGDERVHWKSIARVMSLCNVAKISDYRVAVIPEGDSLENEGGSP